MMVVGSDGAAGGAVDAEAPTGLDVDVQGEQTLLPEGMLVGAKMDRRGRSRRWILGVFGGR